MPPGSTLLIQFKIIQEFLYSCGQSPPSGLLIPWARNALWTSAVVITEAWEAGEILSRQTSSHIEPSGIWEAGGERPLIIFAAVSHARTFSHHYQGSVDFYTVNIFTAL